MSGKKLIKILFIKIFTSDILNSLINIILPVFISIHCTIYKNELSWWIVTTIIGFVIIIFNVLSILIRKNQNKNKKELNIIYKCYNDQSVINNKTATKIFRLNKLINEYLSDQKPINKKVFDKVADFQTISFLICESIHNLLKDEFGEDINCEVTLMKKYNPRNIKMIAYANNENKMPSSYKTSFKSDDTNIYFVKLFNDLNAEISCLVDKESVHKNFKQLQGSDIREDKICQYIGIPIRTNRNEIELLLQIDISKEKVFGKNKSEVLLFAKNILEPYAILLHKSYERDLIFNQYYDMMVSVLSNIHQNNKNN